MHCGIHISDIGDQMRLPWMLLGDVNQTMSMEVKTGCREHNLRDAKHLVDILDVCQFIDLGFSGPKFTWSNGRERL